MLVQSMTDTQASFELTRCRPSSFLLEFQNELRFGVHHRAAILAVQTQLIASCSEAIALVQQAFMVCRVGRAC
jgi:hypothetical protein